MAAGSAKFPQTVWGSRTGDYLDFTRGTADDDAYIFTIAADEGEPHQPPGGALHQPVVHTMAASSVCRAAASKPITPTNVRIRPIDMARAAACRPVTVGKESGVRAALRPQVRNMVELGRLRRLRGARRNGAGRARVTEGGGVTSIWPTSRADLVLWAVRGDGAMLSCTLDRDQSVIGWARHSTDGVRVGGHDHSGDREKPWAIVRRTVEQPQVRYLRN